MPADENSAQPFGLSITQVAHVVIDTLDLPESTKKFLVENGLPVGGSILENFGIHIEFEVDGGITKSVKSDGTTFYIIGNDGNTRLALRAGTGELVSIGTDDSDISFYWNSSIEQLLRFAQLYVAKFSGFTSEPTDTEVAEIIKQLVREYKAIDPVAMGDHNTAWVALLEDIFWMLDVEENDEDDAIDILADIE